MTAVDAQNLRRRADTICAGRAKKPPDKLEQMAVDVVSDASPERLRRLFEGLRQQKRARVFRPELYNGTLEVLSVAEFADMEERTELVRNRRRFTARAPYSKTIGSTLLLKGLESTSALILDGGDLTARHLYVALTRATHQVLILSDTVNSR